MNCISSLHHISSEALSIFPSIIPLFTIPPLIHRLKILHAFQDSQYSAKKRLDGYMPRFWHHISGLPWLKHVSSINHTENVLHKSPSPKRMQHTSRNPIQKQLALLRHISGLYRRCHGLTCVGIFNRGCSPICNEVMTVFPLVYVYFTVEKATQFLWLWN